MTLEKEIINSRANSPFSFKNKVGRVLWKMIEKTLFRWSPRPFFGWRRFLLRLFGAKIGKGVHIYPGVMCWAPWNIEVGSHTGIADGVTLYSQDKIVIGSRCVISQGAHLCTGTHDYKTPFYKLITKPIVIKDYCWIAAEAFIHPGVIINEGVVVGARSVVLSALPEWSVCAGNPCVLLKKRKQS
jgi:putative colanic acid biosynthesis acetyltransferase WcaF